MSKQSNQRYRKELEHTSQNTSNASDLNCRNSNCCNSVENNCCNSSSLTLKANKKNEDMGNPTNMK